MEVELDRRTTPKEWPTWGFVKHYRQMISHKRDTTIFYYTDNCIKLSKDKKMIKEVYGELKDMEFVFY